jgi:serine/threonine protein kinase
MNTTPVGSPRRVAYWEPARIQKYLATSGSHFIGLLEDGHTVLKYPHHRTDDTLQCLRNEADWHLRIGPHENLVSYKGFIDDELLLEYCERGALDGIIRDPNVLSLTDERKLIIGRQVVSCLVYLHSKIFIHCEMIEARFRAGLYPDMNRAAGTDAIIRSCWTSK